MLYYIARRLLLFIPTLFGIMLITFTIAQFVPGGPVERVMMRLQGLDSSASSRLSGAESNLTSMDSGGSSGNAYRGGQGIDQKIREDLKRKFNLDKPATVRFFNMMWDYFHLDFGRSYFKGQSVLDLIKKALPVSISLGLWITLLSYAISIPLGIRKAVKDGSSFDVWTSTIITIGYSIPGFILGILLIILFAGGSFWKIFPDQGLISENFASLSLGGKILDYAHHLVLPLIALGVGSFTTLTLLTKNSFLDEIRKQYVLTARMKGLPERRVLYGHVFRNAMLIVIAGFPGAFIGAFFTGSLLIEQAFSIDGLGRLSYLSIVDRDYAVVFATQFIFSLIGIVIALLSDIVYMLVDPRIDFEAREA